MSNNMRASIHNFFKIEVIDSVTGEMKQVAKAENVVCDALFSYIGTKKPYFNYIAFGSGSGTPSSSDTSLFARIGEVAVSAQTPTYVLNYGVASAMKHITLTELQYSGRTFSEVGISYATGNGTLCTHAMLQDMNGNVITIDKTSSDIINIYATLFVHWDSVGYSDIFMSDTGAEPTVSSDAPYAGTWVRWMLGNAPSNLPDTYFKFSYGNNAGNSPYGGYTQVSAVTYNAAEKKLNISCPRISASEWNVDGGIGSVHIGVYSNAASRADVSEYWFGGKASSFIQLSEIIGESVGVGDGNTNQFRTKFDRDSTMPMKVYVNGQQVTNYHYVDAPITSSGNKYTIPIREDSTDSSLIYQRGVNFGNAVHSYIDTPFIVYNPYHENYKITRAVLTTVTTKPEISASNDLISWSALIRSNDIPAQYQNFKYFKFNMNAIHTGVSLTIESGKNIVFDEPPAVGAVITADYTPSVIPKDSDHVLDLSFSVTFGEYVPD